MWSRMNFFLPLLSLLRGAEPLERTMHSVDELHARIRPLSIESGIVQHYFGTDFLISHALLTEWITAENEEAAAAVEERLAYYASTCSSGLVDAMFADFKEYLRLKRVTALNDGILELEARLNEKRTEYVRRRAAYQPQLDRFGPAYVYIKKRMEATSKHACEMSVADFRDKEERVGQLAESLRDCPEEETRARSDALIAYVRELVEIEGLNSDCIKALCEIPHTEILNKSGHRTKMNRTKGEVDKLLKNLKEKRDALAELTDQYLY